LFPSIAMKPWLVLLAAVLVGACSWDEPPRPIPVAQRAPAQGPAQTPVQTPAPALNPLDASVYRLDGGDAVRIEVLIDPSGYINYPFLGKVQAARLTVRELEARIRDGLRAGYLINPDVRVGLARYRPVYIGGQVRAPGVYPYALGLNVERALTLAGGVTAFGTTNRIFIQRHGTRDDARSRVELDTPVRPGDYIIVEERLF
jgi:protein involved in polysaccharide export with SLBB domain